MPVLSVSLMEPIWDQFAELLPERPDVVHGSGYERIATPGCSDRTIRRRVQAWAAADLATELHALVLAQYDRMIGIEFDDIVVDGCITKAPCGGEKAGRSPVDRGKQGLKRSTLADTRGVPLHLVSAGANRHDAPLLGPTLDGLDVLRPQILGSARILAKGRPKSALRHQLERRVVLGHHNLKLSRLINGRL